MVPVAAIEPQPVIALPETPTAVPTHDAIERINDLGITFGCWCWPLVVRRPRKAGNLTGAGDRQFCLHQLVATSRLADGVKIFDSERPLLRRSPAPNPRTCALAADSLPQVREVTAIPKPGPRNTWQPQI